jgi:1,4-alpha-glucan branching enzyme
MSALSVNFVYRTGLRQPFLRAAQLTGSWTTQGLHTQTWSEPLPMEAFTADDGCPAFRATVELDGSQVGQSFTWGVAVSTAEGADAWGIMDEIDVPGSSERIRSFELARDGQTECYYLTHCRRLGANKLELGDGRTGIRFACWAPNAQLVELVIGEVITGYISNDGKGATASYPMHRTDDGVWETPAGDAAPFTRFDALDHQPYMFRITRADGSVSYRTDLYSRCQIGQGNKNPEAPPDEEGPWNGTRADLDGSKSCSVVIDPDRVSAEFDEGVWPPVRWLAEDDFWSDEHRPGLPVPARLGDLVIYELHVDGLGFQRADAGTLQDAMDIIPYLRDLGVNAVELMPMSEFSGRAGWGYSTSHYFSIEYAGGGRDQFKHFVRECHRHGLAVILDAVYNHYTFDAERAEWAYDSARHEDNIYYWYEGDEHNYPSPEGGYLDNGSSGWAPNYRQPMVRRMFTSSAAALVAEFHFDGIRVDLTQAIHRDNVRHADGHSVPDANLFGQKLLREWSRTLNLIRPGAFLIAEDHTGWAAVYQPADSGGLGFDATWYADFYHHLVGGPAADAGHARLIRHAGYGGDEGLQVDWFAGALAASAGSRVVYHSSHDEVGNAEDSGRVMSLAVNRAPLLGDTRRYAEARSRFACGMTLIAPGTPMFFMGEEVGASQPYRYDDFGKRRASRVDLLRERAGDGSRLYTLYQDQIRLRLAHPALRAPYCDVVHVHDENRMIAVRRWDAEEELLVIGTLSNHAFNSGYQFRNANIPDAEWTEIFTSDASEYGGTNLRNPDPLRSGGGSITVNVPANSVLVLQRRH